MKHWWSVLMMMAALCVAEPAQAQLTLVPNVIWTSSFEGSNPGASWSVTGNAGFDKGAGFARTGSNNGWVRNSSGWNALTSVPIVVGKGNWDCQIEAYVRSSGNVTGLYFSALAPDGSIIFETPWDYKRLAVWPNYGRIPNGATVRGGPSNIRLRVGFWGNGQDAWVQVDDVKLDCVHWGPT